jgi:2-polyprenyl-3-methyl-5-hydroxy-6-metoxy-1,4-benzoquinol methylase
VTSCDVCGGEGAALAYAGLCRCASCSHVWADLSIETETLHRLYQRSYFFGDEYSNYLEDRSIIEKNFAGRLATLRRFLSSSHRSLFEIGCAYGFFLNAVRASFESVEGIDVSEEAVRFATQELGIPVLGGDLLDADLSGRSFDVVCLWDTIEHLAAPRQYLEKISAHMPAGSLVAITTGDIGSLNARLQRGRWRLIHPPTHLHYFTRRSLTRLLERCGFRVVHAEHCGVYRSVGGMLHNLVALGWKWPRVGRWLRSAVPPGLDMYLNLYDLMYIVAERR